MFSQPSQAISNDLTLYLWAAGISGTAILGSHGVPSLPVDVGFDDILDDLEFGFQVHYEGVGEKWGGGLDYTYIKLGNTNDAGVSGEAKTTLAELFGIYRANPAIDVLAGVRFLGMDMRLNDTVVIDAEGERSLTDFYAGARARLPVSESVLFALRGGYRWLDYDLDKDDGSIEAKLVMSMTGPLLGSALNGNDLKGKGEING